MSIKTTQQNIPSEWKNYILSDLCKSLDNRRVPITKSDRVSGDVPYYGATGIIDYVDGHTFDEEILLIGEDGADWSPYANKAFIVKGKSWVNNHAHVLKCNNNSSHEYLEQYLNWKNIDVYTTGGTRKKLNKEALMNIPVCLPESKTEQQRIAKILGAVDEDIAKTQEVIEVTEKLKRGLMQQLFTRGIGHTKFKETKIGDICETSSGGTPSRSKPEYFQDGRIPWLTSGEVREGKIYKSEQFITETALKNSSAKIFPIDTVLIAMYGVTAGQVGILKIEASTNQAICGILPSKHFLPEFLYQYLLFQSKKLRDLAGGGAQPNISQKIIREQHVSVPSIDEQQKIAEILSAVDEKISINKKLKEKLTLLKKGLMQDLLCGAVRVITT